MASLLGTSNIKLHENGSFLKNINLLKKEHSYIVDPIYKDENILSTKVHKGFLTTYPSSIEKYPNTFFWMEGEIYNFNQLKTYLNQKFENITELFLYSFNKEKLKEVLSLIDGYFAAVIYDSKQKNIYLFNDRYGIKPLYYSIKNGHLYWSSELKGFKHAFDTQPKINLHLIQPFIDLSYIPNNETWINNVYLLDASTIAVYDIKKNNIEKKRYWYWAYVKKNNNISFNSACEGFFHHLKSAVNRRANPDENIGITLSGGVDSRVILSLISFKLPAITFGLPNSVDVIQAKKVANKNKIAHNYFEFKEFEWFHNRIKAIWETDGMANVFHLHTAPVLDKMQNLYKINLNGFGGGLNLAGRWIINPNQRIRESSARIRLKEHLHLVNINDSFYDFDHEDPFYIDTQLRRFTTGGSLLLNTVMEQRKPFMDKDLLDFLFSIPDDFRINGRLLFHTINTYFPSLFRNIYTTQGIYPVGKDKFITDLIKYKLKNIPIKLGLKKDPTWAYINYSDWILQPNFIDFLNNLFNNKNSFIEEYTTLNPINDFLLPHFNKSIDFSEKLLAIVTIEIWLRQYFNEKVPSYN